MDAPAATDGGHFEHLPRTNPGTFKGPHGPLKTLVYLAPRAGFEPATNRLTAGCSTTELPGNKPMLWQGAYNKARLLCQLRTFGTLGHAEMS
jgi:hypothetical protein